MDHPIYQYWHLRLKAIQSALERNRFKAHVVDNTQQARELAMDQLIPATGARNISWGGSMTFVDSGLYKRLKTQTELEILDTFDKSIAPEQMLERRRQALCVDLFITGTNAITETGQLINLDMIGNRVAALTFGPRHVIVFAGRNKIVPDLSTAMQRIKNYTAPANVIRLDKKNPCAQTASCQDCNGPDRICNHWVITEKSFPKGRITVVLINEDLGL